MGMKAVLEKIESQIEELLTKRGDSEMSEECYDDLTQVLNFIDDNRESEQ